MKTITTKEIATSGLFCGLAIIFGMFAHFRFLSNHVFLISIILFLGSFFTRYTVYILASLIAVFFADLYNGYLIYSYVSIVTYGIGLSVFKFFQIQNSYILYLVGIIVSSLIITLVYYLLDLLLFETSMALMNLYTNFLQGGICILLSFWLYFPVVKLKEVIKWN